MTITLLARLTLDREVASLLAARGRCIRKIADLDANAPAYGQFVEAMRWRMDVVAARGDLGFVEDRLLALYGFEPRPGHHVCH